MKRVIYRYGFVALTMLAVLSGCTESESIIEGINGGDPSIIHIGGIENSEVETMLGLTTRASADDKTPVVDAETVDWLLGPLFGGLDITYGKVANKPEDRNQQVAILRLLKKDGATGITEDDIKYSQYAGPKDEKIADYSFKYRISGGQEGEDAKWYDNGEHYFQGVFVPDKLRYMEGSSPETVNGATSEKAPNLMTDQSKDGDNDNYTLLARYLGMPADANIHATVGRVKLPFRHRLARVQAYVLIDPTMIDPKTGQKVIIEGYKKDNNIKDKNGNVIDDAATTEIKFCKVKVLAGVEQQDDATGHATLTPRWDEARKVIPHFAGEKGCQNSIGEDYAGYEDTFIMFYDIEKKVYVFPANDKDWEDAKTAWDREYNKALGAGTSDKAKREAAETADQESGFNRTVYNGKVPVYDLIVRPTYKSEEMVMYDEDLTETSAEDIADMTNSIDFELTLSNGLQYTKHFEFDLDANYQTIVYLRINSESIDYNSSGADKWDEPKDPYRDGYYGVNNQNGNTLSFAGSSWQRAYRIGSKNNDVTDGHWYGKDDDGDDDAVQDDDNMPWYPQYVSSDQWIKMFSEAHEGGLHHGDYFILDDKITIDATKLPDDFIFTGHLDGQDHIITLTNTGKDWTEYVATTDYSISLFYSDKNGTEYHLPQLYTKVHHDANYTSDDEFLEIDGVIYIKRTLEHIEEVWHEATEGDVADGKADKVGDKVVDTEESYNEVQASQVKQDAYDEYIETHPSMNQAMTAPADTYYEKFGENNYGDFINRKPSVLYKAIPHTSGTTLFAGLNGIYDAAIGEANVHKENGIFVPYVDNQTKTGWRAEIINTKIKGADLFPFTNPSEDSKSVLKADGSYNDKVSGYVYNCWKVSSDDSRDKIKIKSHTPALPKYK
ncbi:MAG: hypothetical protein MJZ35_00130 [Bacteroidaceae bacterium]|nr:hypothetical protein [Bacteroidaceae bacterium]